MFSSDFSLFRNDSTLSSLQSLDLDDVRDQLRCSIPAGYLDAPLAQYKICNLRYSPGRKLVVGLTAPESSMPIGIRVFPPVELDARYHKAQDSGATHVYRLPESSALAWVFPCERKLDLQIINDRAALERLWLSQRQMHLLQMELIHFVPEHAYTIRLTGYRSERHPSSESHTSGSAECDYLKISYDDRGALAALRASALATQCQSLPICVAADTDYLPQYRLMFQSALDRKEEVRLTSAEAAFALSHFHALKLPVSLCTERSSTVADRLQRARDLLLAVFPDLLAQFDELSYRIRRSTFSDDSPPVLLHGDAHPGNLLRLRDGRVGIIDLDQVHRGQAVDDLASFYAFRLWKDLPQGKNTQSLLRGFDDFIDAYNGHVVHRVSHRCALQALALHLCAERIARGIARGKVKQASELISFMQITDQALQRI